MSSDNTQRLRGGPLPVPDDGDPKYDRMPVRRAIATVTALSLAGWATIGTLAFLAM